MPEDTTRPPEEGLRNLLTRHGNDWPSLGAELYGQTGKLRDKVRELSAKLEEVEAKVPRDGSVVLTGKQHQEWQEYQELGSPAEIKAADEKRQAVEAEVKQLKRRESLTKAAEAEGYKPSVLEKLLGDSAELKVATEKVKTPDGEVEEQMVYQVTRDGKDVSLSEFVTSEWGEDFLPVLTADKPEEPRRKAVPQPGKRPGGRPQEDFLRTYLDARNPKPTSGEVGQ